MLFVARAIIKRENITMDIPLICNDSALSLTAKKLREKWGFVNQHSEDFRLHLLPEHLALEQINDPQQGLVFVDFVSFSS